MLNKEKLSKIVGHEILNSEIYTEALTHRSYINEIKNESVPHNERLEFLGDAILEIVITEYLYDKYPDFKEGQLTSLRSALVKTESLAFEAQKLQLGELIIMSKGEESTGGRNRPYILANTMESIIGALYKDQGYEAAKSFIIANIAYKTDEILENRSDVDSKSKLQELSQEQLKTTPVYVLVSSEGPDHAKTFEMSVNIEAHSFGTGKGKSKQEAEQNAAMKALESWDELVKKYYPDSND